MEINHTSYRRSRIGELLRNNDNIHLSESPESPGLLDVITENNTNEISSDNNITNNRIFEIRKNSENNHIYFMSSVSQIDMLNIIEMENKSSEKSGKAFYCGFLNEDLKPSGYGTIINQNNDTIQGYFENGFSFIKNAKTLINNIRYETEILNGSPDGNGHIYYPNGNTYIGNINNGVENGLGQMIYSDKTIYNGNWNIGMREGEGHYIDAM